MCCTQSDLFATSPPSLVPFPVIITSSLCNRYNYCVCGYICAHETCCYKETILVKSAVVKRSDSTYIDTYYPIHRVRTVVTCAELYQSPAVVHQEAPLVDGSGPIQAGGGGQLGHWRGRGQGRGPASAGVLLRARQVSCGQMLFITMQSCCIGGVTDMTCSIQCYTSLLYCVTDMICSIQCYTSLLYCVTNNYDT